MPEGLSRDILAMAYRQAKADLMPVAADQFAVAIQPLLDFAVAFGKARFQDQPHREAVIAEYRQSLGHLPADLIDLAISRHKRAWVYPGMPTPAELLAHIDGEMTKRRIAKLRVELAGQRVSSRQRHPVMDEGSRGKLNAVLSGNRMETGE